MNKIRNFLSMLFIIPLTVNGAQTHSKIEVSLDEIINIQEAEILETENDIEINIEEKTLSAPSELIKELKRSGLIKEEDASQTTDCKRT